MAVHPSPTSAVGVLLINLGTPAGTQTAQVRTYLREFLDDPRVLDIPRLARWALLNLVILPWRPAKAAEAYRKIWGERGSPLMFHSEDLAAAVQARLGSSAKVVLAMRYGRPSLAEGLKALHDAGCERVVVMPLYPQYASSSTGTALALVYQEAGRLWNVPHLQVVPPFYDHPGFIAAMAAQAAPILAEVDPERVLYSFHGLPERHVKKCDATAGHCLAAGDCCDQIGAVNRFCYRAHCVQTANALSRALDLAPEQTLITFQSRLGRTPWLKPYTDHVLGDLAQDGVKRVVVMCPAFTTDCLETLEEIGLRAAEDFKARGGEVLKLVPSVNATGPWVDAVCDMLAPHLAAVSAVADRA